MESVTRDPIGVKITVRESLSTDYADFTDSAGGKTLVLSYQLKTIKQQAAIPAKEEAALPEMHQWEPA
ncbi:MAG: hypothetical protein P4N24_04920, partial [Acidobacteriota bacterium]|nr:hypothetical protein [Acidobacteriota bacterium]